MSDNELLNLIEFLMEEKYEIREHYKVKKYICICVKIGNNKMVEMVIKPYKKEKGE